MGLASGSALAAATIFALSLREGIRITRLLEIFDLFLHLSSPPGIQRLCVHVSAPAKSRSMSVPDVRRSLERLAVGRFERAHSDEISIAELAYLVGSEREQRLGSPGSRDELDFHGSQSVNLDDRAEVAAT